MEKGEKLKDLKEISINDLSPGDILLYHGKGLVSWLIRFFDGSIVNHAAVYTDEKRIIEAVGEGVQEVPLEESFTDGHNKYVVVKRLKKGPGDMSPVIGVAKTYRDRGNDYEYKSIFLLILISIVGRIHGNNPFAWLVTRMMKAHFSRNMRDDPQQRMICSELAYRCYNEAQGPYSFLVDEYPMIRSVYTAGCESSIKGRQNLVGRALYEAKKRDNMPRGKMNQQESEELMTGMYKFTQENILKSNLKDEAEPIVELWKTVPHFVSPRDIHCSTSLKSVGYIKLKDLVFPPVGEGEKQKA